MAGVAMLLLLSGAAVGQGLTFDKPVSYRTIKPKSASDPLGERQCTVFPDFTIRQTNTDTPGPDRASLIPKSAACNGAHAAGEKVLDTGGFTFAGRKGGFLVFIATDPNGATPFKVLDTSGRTLYTDALTGNLRIVELRNGLHLRFTRAVNSTCSVLGDATCWARIGCAGLLPPTIAPGKPPTEACAASYARNKAPAGDSSIITYDVDTTFDPVGRLHARPRGAPGCEPLP